MSKNMVSMNITKEAEEMTLRESLTVEDKVRMFDRWCNLVSGIKTGRFNTLEYTTRMQTLLRDCENYGFIKEESSKG
jgi:hypothetical protein